MNKNETMKIWILMAALTATLLLCVVSASACTMVYVGSNLTADSSSFMARSEDYSNSYNKIAYVNPTGKYAAGSTYNGCYGFTHTFNHDSTPTPLPLTTIFPVPALTAVRRIPTPLWRKLAPMRRVSPFPLWSL